MDTLDFRSNVRDLCQLDPRQPLVIGVSGGPDSLCLLDLLNRLDYSLVVAHFDHALRTGSEEDARIVGQMAEERRLPFRTARLDVANLALKEHLSIEEAARKARYHFLFDLASAVGAQAVAVAHTADDQVETVLMHLLRGAGLSGLKGMGFRSVPSEWHPSIPLVRPLLKTWRDEVEEYCSSRGLQPRFDPTNQETVYFRNRLRHQLIPYLQGYNPKVKEVLWRMSQTLAGDYEVLLAANQPAWEACLLEQGDQFISLSLPALNVLLPGQQRSILRRAIAWLRPTLRDIDYSSVERGRAFLTAPNATHQLDLAAGLRLFIEGERLFLAEWGAPVLEKAWPQLIPGQVVELQVPGEQILSNGQVLRAQLQPVPPAPGILANAGPFRAWLDASQLSIPLTIRTRHPGDRFQPLGFNGQHLKLSDFWINARLPARARPGWPLVCSGERIAWIPGFRPAQFCQITSTSCQTIFIELTTPRA